MGEANLAIVLGPNLLRPRHESMLRMIEDARHVNAIIELFLREFEYFILVFFLKLFYFFFVLLILFIKIIIIIIIIINIIIIFKIIINN